MWTSGRESEHAVERTLHISAHVPEMAMHLNGEQLERLTLEHKLEHVSDTLQEEEPYRFHLQVVELMPRIRQLLQCANNVNAALVYRLESLGYLFALISDYRSDVRTHPDRSL